MYKEVVMKNTAARGTRDIKTARLAPRKRTSRKETAAMSAKPAEKISDLAKQAEKLFSSQTLTAPLAPLPEYIGEQRVVQSYTTYSACEEPIPNFFKRQ